MRKLLPVLILLVFCLSLLALPVHAQEATAEPTVEATEAPAGAEATAEPTAEATAAPDAEAGDQAPTGLSTLVLLIGLGAVAAVGLTFAARDTLRNRQVDKP